MNDWSGYQNYHTDPIGFFEDWSAETVLLSEGPALQLSDTLSLTETLRLEIRKRITENLGLNESLRLEIHKVLTDTVLLGELLDVEFIEGVLELSVDDTVSFVETLQRGVSKSLQETIGLDEDIALSIERQLSESVQWSETLTLLKTLGGPIVIEPGSEKWLASRIIAELFVYGQLIELRYYEGSSLLITGVKTPGVSGQLAVSVVEDELVRASSVDMESITKGQAHG